MSKNRYIKEKVNLGLKLILKIRFEYPIKLPKHPTGGGGVCGVLSFTQQVFRRHIPELFNCPPPPLGPMISIYCRSRENFTEFSIAHLIFFFNN